MSVKNSFLYNDDFASVSYGEGHPMRPARLRLCRELISALGLDNLPHGEITPSLPAGYEDLLLVHSPEYIRILQEADSGSIPAGAARYGLGAGDNPVFRGVYRWSCLSAGASLQAARMVLDGEAKRAFNIAGGLHHAMQERASGFCYINDAALAIEYLVRAGKRVAYVDVDAHHGDGVQEAFYNTDKVLTISLHESGQNLFPGTGFVEERGSGEGLGYSVNVPLPPETGDGLYLKTLKALVPDLISAFSPDVLVTQLGADSLAGDPLTHLKLTISGFEEIVEVFSGLNLPWVALGGGGYDIGATAS
ncbi:MAG: acetoin utilization protein AcuC, partial [Thermodesulfobacteriota bacterium]